MRLFVYGTLLKGLERNSLLAESEYIGQSTIQASLYDCGSFPGIKQGDNIVHGELYEIDENTLLVLDQVEGYLENNWDVSLFIRREIPVKIKTCTECVALCYFYNQEVEDQALISHGDYLFHFLSNIVF